MKRITLVGQDWGGFIGLRLATKLEERFARIVAANTFLPTGDTPPGEGLLNWQRFSQQTPVFRASEIIQMSNVNEMPPEVGAAYDAPFPHERYQAGARQFPLLISPKGRKRQQVLCWKEIVMQIEGSIAFFPEERHEKGLQKEEKEWKKDTLNMRSTGLSSRDILIMPGRTGLMG